MIFSRIKNAFREKFNEIFNRNDSIDEIIDEIEELLILSDVGVKSTSDICGDLRKKLVKETDYSKEHVIKCLKEEMIQKLSLNEKEEPNNEKKVILVVGVNGVRKDYFYCKAFKYLQKTG